MSHSRFTSRDKIFFYFTTEPSTLSFPAIYRMLATNKPNNGQTLYRVHCTASKQIIYYSNVVINPCQHFSIFHNRANYAIYVSSAVVLWSTLRDAMQVEGGEWGEERWSTLHSPPLPVPRSLSSSTIVALCLPTLALHGITPVFRLIKWIRNWALWQAVPT